MKKFLYPAALSMCLLGGMTCMAAGIDTITVQDIEGSTTSKSVTVTGTVPQNADVSIKVYKKGKTESDLTGNALKDVLYYGKQKKADAVGAISFNFPMNGEKGAYKVQINYAGSLKTDKLSDIFVFLPNEDAQQFVSELNDMHKTVVDGAAEEITEAELDAFAAKITGFVNEQYLIMPEVYGSLSENERRAVFKLMMYDADYTKISEIPEAFTTAYNLSKLSTAADTQAIDTLLKKDEEFTKEMGLKDSQALTVYLDEQIAFDRTAAAAALGADNIVNAEGARTAFEEKLVASAVGAQTKYTVTSVIRQLNSYIGVDFTKYDAATDKQESFDEKLAELISSEPSADDIKNAWKTATEEVLDKTVTQKEPSGPSSSQTSNGGGGGGSRNDTNPPVVLPVEQKPEVEKRVPNFKDLSGFEWAEEDIKALYADNYLDGVSETSFAPGAAVKREELLKLLLNAAGIKGTAASASFTDVVRGAWYEEFIAAGVENGIINGNSDGSFGIGVSITREDMAVMIYRILKDKVTPSADKSADFTDFETISDYAKDAVEFVSKIGIINGMEDGSFCPKENASRAQAAVCIKRMLKYIK